MQALKVNQLNKYDLFEKNFQVYFVVSKSTKTPKSADKYITIKAKNTITDKIEEFSFGFEEFVKTVKAKKEVLSYLYSKGDEVVFFNRLELCEVVVKKNWFVEILPFLVEDDAYEIYFWKSKVLFIKPVKIFVDVNVLNLPNEIMKKEKANYQNETYNDNATIKIDTRKYF